MPRLIKIALILGLIFILVGIVYSTYEWFVVRSDIKSTVRDYNEIICQAYLRSDPELLTRYTTPDEKTRITLYILYLYKYNKVIKCNLIDLSFVSVKVEGDQATVKTKEKWIYEYLSAKTKKELSKPIHINYDATYGLVRQGQRWLVDALEVKGKGAPHKK